MLTTSVSIPLYFYKVRVKLKYRHLCICTITYSNRDTLLHRKSCQLPNLKCQLPDHVTILLTSAEGAHDTVHDLRVSLYNV